MKVKPVPKVLQQGRDSEANLNSTKQKQISHHPHDDVTPGLFQSGIALITSKGTEEERAEDMTDTVGAGRIPSKAQNS